LSVVNTDDDNSYCIDWDRVRMCTLLRISTEPFWTILKSNPLGGNSRWARVRLVEREAHPSRRWSPVSSSSGWIITFRYRIYPWEVGCPSSLFNHL